MPISKYKKIQTGAKTQLGGEKVGFASAAYQVETEETVKKEPITTANWQITIDAINLNLDSISNMHKSISKMFFDNFNRSINFAF